MSHDNVLLKIEGLKVEYYTRAGVVKAVDDVNLLIRRGETVGLVGESGCGKTTVGLSIMRLLPPNGRIVRGKIIFDGENLLEKSEEEMRRIRGRRISMIFQDPMTSLNPLMRIRDHLIETVMTHENVSRDEALKRAEQIVEMLGIEKERIHDYPHQFSGGMRQRIMIALALILNPDLVIADEPTTALDVIVQAQILELLKDLKKKFNMSMILITHDLSIVSELTDRVAVMYAGKLVEFADTIKIFEEPFHPYTEGLLASIPRIDVKQQKLQSIPGMPPDLINPPPGCRFHPRCPYAMDICKEQDPPMVEIEKGRFVKCFRYGGRNA
ncbi:MAG: ABC transporter ATP-binding protein [Candidatus Baldrarchaeia archaeon]